MALDGSLQQTWIGSNQKPAAAHRRRNGRAHRPAVDPSGFFADETVEPRHIPRQPRRKHVDTYLNEFVFRYNCLYYRHALFESWGSAADKNPRVAQWLGVHREVPYE